MKKLSKILILMALVPTFGLVTGCSTPGEISPQTRYIVLDKPAPVPNGVLRYCWEEPMVQLEPDGPGLDSDGRWYRPEYVAVREVRQGRWRPCKAMPSELKGER